MKLGIQDEGLYVNKQAVAHKMKMLMQKDKQDWRKQEQIRQQTVQQIFAKLNNYSQGDLVNIEVNQVMKNEAHLTTQKVKEVKDSFEKMPYFDPDDAQSPINILYRFMRR